MRKKIRTVTEAVSKYNFFFKSNNILLKTICSGHILHNILTNVVPKHKNATQSRLMHKECNLYTVLNHTAVMMNIVLVIYSSDNYIHNRVIIVNMCHDVLLSAMELIRNNCTSEHFLECRYQRNKRGWHRCDHDPRGGYAP